MVEAQTETQDAQSREVRFVYWLISLEERKDRGALAALRRGLGKPAGMAPEMFPLLVPWTSNLWQQQANWYYVIASLFALHPMNTTEPYHNFGTTMKLVRGQRMQGGRSEGGESSERFDAIERRFIALLRCHPDELADHLRHIIWLAASEQVPVNWMRLLKDVQHWDHPERYVQRQWANKFWSADRPETQEVSS